MGNKRNNFLDEFKTAKENSIIFKSEVYLLFLPFTKKYISTSYNIKNICIKYELIKIFYKEY